MAVDSTPRSVADATRFTSNTPHANTKARTPQSTSPARSAKPVAGSRPSPPRRPAPTALAGGLKPESLDERVRRLRAAHLAARNHEVSRMDKVINSSRRYMDAAHKYTVMGLMGFSGLALIVTVYAAIDMMVYNRKRRNEFFALQKELGTDSLEAARLAYMTGSASEAQIIMVEEATAKAKQAGIPMPALLSTHPEHGAEGHAALTERSLWPGESMQETSLSAASEGDTQKKTGLGGWFSWGGKSEDTATSDRHNSAEKPGFTEQRDTWTEKAKSAFDIEREKQRKGGPLDQVGVERGTKRRAGFGDH